MKRTRQTKGFDTFKAAMEKKGKCTHVAGQMVTSNGVCLPCCHGTSTICKARVNNILTRHIEYLYSELDKAHVDLTKQKKDKKDIKDQLSQEREKPTVINNYTQNNYKILSIGLNDKSIQDVIYEAKRLGANRDQVYGEIFGLLQQSSDPESVKLVQSVKEGTVEDKCLAEIDVHNAIVGALKDNKDPEIEKFLVLDEATVIENSIANGVAIDE